MPSMEGFGSWLVADFGAPHPIQKPIGNGFAGFYKLSAELS